jgi:hypothetical protein
MRLASPTAAPIDVLALAQTAKPPAGESEW